MLSNLLSYTAVRGTLVLCLVFSSLWGVSAQAVEVNDLYVAQVDVADRNRPARQEAFKAALAAVLVKITGDRAASDYPELDLLKETAARYVQRFHYSEGRQGTRLEVSFDGAALERAATDLGISVWGRERPAVVLWLGIQQQGKRYLVGGDAGASAQAALRAAANARALPLILPLMDLEDQSKVAFADVAGGFYEPIRAASARYRPDAVLVAQAESRSGVWRVRWRLHLGEQRENWQTENASLNTALAEGVHRLTGDLARRMSTTGFAEAGSGTLVVVRDVVSLEDQVRVAKYLRGLAPVVFVRPQQLDADTVSFLVQVRGEARDLPRLISLGDTLARDVMQGAGVALSSAQSGAEYFHLIR